MPEFDLHEAARPCRRLITFQSATDPTDEEACVALLRRVARQEGRKTSDVKLVYTGRRRREYRA